MMMYRNSHALFLGISGMRPSQTDGRTHLIRIFNELVSIANRLHQEIGQSDFYPFIEYDPYENSATLKITLDANDKYKALFNLISDPYEVYNHLKPLDGITEEQLYDLLNKLWNGDDLEQLLLDPYQYISLTPRTLINNRIDNLWYAVIWLALVNIFLTNINLFVSCTTTNYDRLTIPLPNYQ